MLLYGDIKLSIRDKARDGYFNINMKKKSKGYIRVRSLRTEIFPLFGPSEALTDSLIYCSTRICSVKH